MLQYQTRKERGFGRWLTERSISSRTLACVSAAIFACSLIPLVIIAVYNYPADDDFGFVLPAATAWVNTGSLWEVLRAIVQKTYDTYLTWQGNFVSTAFFGVTPIIFDIRLYFLSNWFTLALMCLSVGYLLKGITNTWLHADRSAFWIAYPAVMVLMLQFMPSIGYSVYWHNGGMYTVAACTLMQALGLLLRSLHRRFRPSGGNETLKVLLVCFFTCGILLHLPMYAAAYAGEHLSWLKALLGAVHHTLRMFVLDGELDPIHEFAMSSISAPPLWCIW